MCSCSVTHIFNLATLLPPTPASNQDLNVDDRRRMQIVGKKEEEREGGMANFLAASAAWEEQEEAKIMAPSA
jgi:hypothetical protein